LSKNTVNKSAVAADWDRYWRGTWEASAHEDGSPQDAALEGFWQQFFQAAGYRKSQGSLLDVACGNGAVIRYAQQFSSRAPQCFAFDYSHAALLNLQSRYANVCCTAGDGNKPPYVAASFDTVVSQFGIEYAGAGASAVAAVAPLVAPGGYLALVMHLHDGAIYKECADNYRALEDVKQLDILELARSAFLAGFAINARTGSVAVFKQAERAFTPAVRGLEQLLQRWGPQVAGGLLQQLYRDIAEMYKNMSAYAEAEVIAWVDGMTVEIDAYAGRMLSMVNAAVDEPACDRLCQQLSAIGFTRLNRDKLRIGAKAEFAAWTLVAQR